METLFSTIIQSGQCSTRCFPLTFSHPVGPLASLCVLSFHAPSYLSLRHHDQQTGLSVIATHTHQPHSQLTLGCQGYPNIPSTAPSQCLTAGLCAGNIQRSNSVFQRLQKERLETLESIEYVTTESRTWHPTER